MILFFNETEKGAFSNYAPYCRVSIMMMFINKFKGRMRYVIMKKINPGLFWLFFLGMF